MLGHRDYAVGIHGIHLGLHGGVVHRLAVLHFQHGHGLGRRAGLVHGELAGQCQSGI